jgi:CHAT domain-containing protein
VLDALVGASQVHFACHGHAMLNPDRLDAGLSLAAAEELTAADFLELSGFSPRLVVASACQTGMITGYEMADEALSLSTVMIGAGAAGTVASLWSINDFATVAVMTKFYEGLGSGRTPARALRLAQLWVRDLDFGEACEFIEAYPRLAEDLRGPVEAEGDQLDLSRPTFWAGFTLNGV